MRPAQRDNERSGFLKELRPEFRPFGQLLDQAESASSGGPDILLERPSPAGLLAGMAHSVVIPAP
jgi:hypothetical protein